MYRYLLVAVFIIPGTAAAAAVDVSGHASVRDEHTSVDVVFGKRDKAIIHDYYRSYRRDRDDREDDRDREYDDGKGKRARGTKVPPGLAKKGGLPPGLAKRQRLPDDVKYEVLPRELEAKLSPLPSSDYVRVKVGRDFAILDKRTRVVLDVAVALPLPN